MNIRLPKFRTKKSVTSLPKAVPADGAKLAHLRPFPAPKPGQCWPGHWPGQPGPILRGPEAVVGKPAPALGAPLTISDVALLIGCSPWSVRQTLIPRGLPHFRFKASGRLIFYRDQVIRWIEKQQQGGL